MGNLDTLCLNRDPYEKAILQNENAMMINKVTTVEIKNIFKSMIKGVIEGKPAEKLEDNKFNYKQLMIMLIMLCKDNTQTKIKEILQLEAKEKLNPDDLTHILTIIFQTVSACSLQITIHNMEAKRKEDEIEKYRLYNQNVKDNIIQLFFQINKVVDESIKNIFQGISDSSALELSIKFLKLIAVMKYDPGTTFGIRKVLKEYNQEKQNLNEKKEENKNKKEENKDKKKEEENKEQHQNEGQKEENQGKDLKNEVNKEEKQEEDQKNEQKEEKNLDGAQQK